MFGNLGHSSSWQRWHGTSGRRPMWLMGAVVSEWLVRALAPAAGSQRSGSSSGTCGPRSKERGAAPWPPTPSPCGGAAPPARLVSSSQLWMNIHGGAPAPPTRCCDTMCACWSERWRPAAYWLRRPPQMSWLSLSANVLSHDTCRPPDWPPELPESATSPHPHSHPSPKWSRDITVWTGRFHGD